MAFLQDEEKNLLLDRYGDMKWLDDVRDFQCVHCLRVAIYHHVSNCKHLFCHKCRAVLSDRGHCKCPQCKKYITQLDAQNFDVELKIQNLAISCPNKRYGCKYEDQLKNIRKHLMTCVSTQEASLLLACTGIDTMDTVVKKMTKVKATIKDLSERFNVQVTKIGDVNSKFNVGELRMIDIEKNSEELKLTSEKSKEFHSIKLQLVSVQERVESNESIAKQTMDQMSSLMEEMRTIMASMTKEMETLHFKKSEELNPLKAETYEWTIKDVTNTIQKHKWSFESEAFKFKGSKYEIIAFLEKRDGKPHISLQGKEGKPIIELLEKDGLTTVKYIVKDQSDILNEKNVIGYSYLKFNQSIIDHSKFEFGCYLPVPMLSPPYVKNECIKITISLEPPSINRSFISNNGVLKWKVDNYETLKGQFDNCIWSPIFYTSPQGYRVTAALVNVKGFVSIRVLFLTGEYDDSLSNRFPHKTTVTLFNQTNPSNDLVRCTRHEYINIYGYDLGSRTFIEQNGYEKNSSVLISVVIEPVSDTEYNRSSRRTSIVLTTLFFLLLYIIFDWPLLSNFFSYLYKFIMISLEFVRLFLYMWSVIFDNAKFDEM